jgi:phage terminase Nu1 subunit (DNA packaging protein)
MNFKQILDKWPSPFITRKKLCDMTGGIINSRTIANLDSLGRGIKGKTKVGGLVVYEVANVVEWLEERERAQDKKTCSQFKNRKADND